MINDKIFLITGGTGTIGTALIDYIFANYEPKVIRIFSRDESKQKYLMVTQKTNQKKALLYLPTFSHREL